MNIQETIFATALVQSRAAREYLLGLFRSKIKKKMKYQKRAE